MESFADLLLTLARQFEAANAALYAVREPADTAGYPRILIEHFVEAQKGARPGASSQALFRPFGFHRQLALPLNQIPYGAPGSLGIVLCRTPAQPPWRAEDEHHLLALVPILALAVDRHRRCEALAHEGEALRGALAAVVDQPCLLYDAEDRLVWLSASAATIFGERRAHAPAARAPEASRASAGVLRRGEGFSLLLLASARPAAAARYGLSGAEARVLRLIAQGLSNQAIAKTLFVSVNTVRTHVKHILQKAQVKNRVELMAKLGREAGGGFLLRRLGDVEE